MSENLFYSDIPVVQFLSNWFDELESTFANLKSACTDVRMPLPLQVCCNCVNEILT